MPFMLASPISTDPVADRLQRLHDARLVRSSALQGGAARRCDSRAWAIAFIEYCLAVPANRWGSAVYTTAQLKTIQEVITLLVFAGFSILYLKEPMTWNYAIGFALVARRRLFCLSRSAVTMVPGWEHRARCQSASRYVAII